MEKQIVYFGATYRFIIQQEVGFQKLLSDLREKYQVKELKDDGETIILVEEKEIEK